MTFGKLSVDKILTNLQISMSIIHVNIDYQQQKLLCFRDISVWKNPHVVEPEAC